MQNQLYPKLLYCVDYSEFWNSRVWSGYNYIHVYIFRAMRWQFVAGILAPVRATLTVIAVSLSTHARGQHVQIKTVTRK